MMKLYLALTVSAALAAAGQVLLKLGADGQSELLGLFNLRVIGGLTLYGCGVIVWLYALTRLPLHVVYPFTMLTLALVLVGSIVFLGERPNSLVLGGWSVVGVGVAIIAFGST